jgi:hypothetical protein
MKELFEKFGILSMKEDSTKAEDPTIPFSKYDTCDTMTTTYKDGRVMMGKYYHRKISTKFQKVNEIMVDWGYTCDNKYKNSHFGKVFAFIHSDYRMPQMRIEYNNIRENLFKIDGVWGWDDCYFDEGLLEENIMKAISWYVKGHKDLLRDIKLRKLLNGKEIRII